jgi:pilus assembly protein CpaC
VRVAIRPALVALLALCVPLAAARAQGPTTAAAPAAPAATGTQSITVPAGIGVLLHLPQPAATVISANPAIARVQPTSPTSLFVTGVAAGRTSVLVTADNGTAIVQYDVTVTPMPAAPTPPVAASLPALPPVLGGEAEAGHAGGNVSPAAAAQAQSSIVQSIVGAGTVKVRSDGNGVVLTGTVPNAAAAESVIAILRARLGDNVQVLDNMVVLGSIQVNVRVRIAEIDRTVTRQLGFNWQALSTGGKGGKFSLGVLTGAGASGPISALSPLGLTPLASVVPNQVGLSYKSGSWDINSIIDALAADQLVSILAEPNLTAQSGETASFLAGGEFPIPIAATGVAGSTSITVEFKQFGVSLAVVPTVLSSTRLNLRVRPEVSELSNNGAVSVPTGSGGTLTIPALTVRRAETTVELGSGQSFAIAGLLERTSTDTTNALPGLGELPVLGALFKSNDFQRGESELVIIVTPYLVKPAPSPDALRLPTDGFKPAIDLDRILLGRQMAPSADGTRLDAGFILK